jgi:hypothetical protein
MPQLTLPTARADIAVRELDAPSLVREVSVAMPPGGYRPPAAEAMAETLRDVAIELVDETAHLPGRSEHAPA